HLVHDQDLWADRGRHGEPEARHHTRRVGPERRVDEVADLGEVDDLLELREDLALAVAEQRAVQEDVLAASQLRMKASPKLQQRRHPATHPDPPARRLEYASYDAQEGALAGPVAADDPE